jgi:hypothetical protein
MVLFKILIGNSMSEIKTFIPEERTRKFLLVHLEDDRTESSQCHNSHLYFSDRHTTHFRMQVS